MDISVVIATYNREYCLERAVTSVVQQTLAPKEIVIVDDGSTDQTRELVEKITKYSTIRIRYKSTSNQGISAARNVGIDMCASEWIAFLDSDDEWLPEKIKKQNEFSLSSPACNLIHTDEVWIRNGQLLNQKKKHRKSGGDIFERSLKLCLISPSSVIMRKKALESYGGFREDIIVCEDYDLWLKISSREQVGFIDEPLLRKYGGHKDQLTLKYFAMDYWRIKSLLSLLGQVTDGQQELILAELANKITILKKGLQKHHRPVELAFFEKLFLAVIAKKSRPPSLPNDFDATFANMTR